MERAVLPDTIASRLNVVNPLVMGGVVQSIRVADTHTAGDAAWLPKRQNELAPRTMFEPVICTKVPPY